MSTEPDDLIVSITPDVMKALRARGFFARLDDLMSPSDEAKSPEKCDGSYRLSERLLREDGFVDEDLDDIFQVLRTQGGCCDCEILYNVTDSSKLKATYWKRSATEHQSTC